MNTAAQRNPPHGFVSPRRFVQMWMRWAVFFFFVAALLGVLLRFFFVGGLPHSFDYTFILHAHSHMAMLGWGYLLVSGLLVFTYIKDPVRLQGYRIYLIGTVVANLGMMVSFPFQGYGLYSIAFSTLHVCVSYAFSYRFLTDLVVAKQSMDGRMVRFAVVWMLLSSLGLWSVAPIGLIFGKLHPLYFLSVQWFLHFQLNGWFVYALLGLLLHHLAKNKAPNTCTTAMEVFIHLSLFLTFSLTISWRIDWPPLIYFNALGVMLQAVAYVWILSPLLKGQLSFVLVPDNWQSRVMYLGLTALIAKALVQFTLVIPEIAMVSHDIRGYVIGFIHLVLLGGITFAGGGLALQRGWLPQCTLSKRGWFFLTLGFGGSEILLFVHGTFTWLGSSTIPHYHLLLFAVSILMPLGLLLVLLRIGKATPTAL